MVGVYFEEAYRNKELPHFFKASAVLVLAGLIGVCANLSNLYHTYEYRKETMRGKREVKHEGDAAAQTSEGLKREYITQWGHGIDERFNFLVANVKGGASVSLSQRKT